MTDLARGGDLASYALFHGVMNVIIASVIGYVLYRLIKTKNSPTKASDYGRNWLAWMALFATLSGLPKVIMEPSPDMIFKFISSSIAFILIAFILGFVYGKFKVRKDSSIGVVDNPNTTSNNKTINSGVNCSNCGAEITPKGAKFCKHCGTKVEQVITTSTTVKAEAIKLPTIEKKIVDEVIIDKPDDIATQQETNKKIEKPLVHKDIKPFSKNNQTRNTLILLSIFVIILIVVFSDTKKSTFSTAFKAPTVTTNNSPSWTRGKHIYNDDCAGCHKADGSGMPPIFPALKNSSVVNGPTPKLIDIILYGKDGMPVFGVKSNTYLAQVITYVKNNFDNSEVYVPYSTIRKKVNLARPNSNSSPSWLSHEKAEKHKSIVGTEKWNVMKKLLVSDDKNMRNRAIEYFKKAHPDDKEEFVHQFEIDQVNKFMNKEADSAGIIKSSVDKNIDGLVNHLNIVDINKTMNHFNASSKSILKEGFSTVMENFCFLSDDSYALYMLLGHTVVFKFYIKNNDLWFTKKLSWTICEANRI
jgi:cytochrome c5